MIHCSSDSDSDPYNNHNYTALIEAIKDCQEMHDLITQSFLLIMPVLQADLLYMPLQITTLVMYCQESHTTIGSSRVQSIKTL